MVGVPFLVIRCDLRAVGADRLALALLDAQQVDDRAAEQEHEHQRGDDGAAGAEGDVAEDVEERELVGEIGQPIEHRIKPCGRLPLSSAPGAETGVRSALTIGPILEPSEPFTMTASPARRAPSTAGSSAAAVSA